MSYFDHIYSVFGSIISLDHIFQFLAIFFGLWGWASFWVFWLRSTYIINCINLGNQSDHSCLWVWSLPEWEGCAIIISLPMPWVCLLCQCVCQCASMLEVCQHARGSSQKCLSFPEVPEGPRCPEGQDIVHCARWLKTHKTVLMA